MPSLEGYVPVSVGLLKLGRGRKKKKHFFPREDRRLFMLEPTRCFAGFGIVVLVSDERKLVSCDMKRRE